MIRKLFMALAALAAAACAAPAPTDTPATTTFIGIDGRPLVSAEGIIDYSVQEALTANPAACAKAGVDLTLRRHAGYDHGYYFVSSFMADQLAWHASRLR